MAKRRYNKRPSKSQDVLINLERDIIYRSKQSQESWRNALMIAENKENPRRSELLRLYKDVVLDNHLSALMDLKRDKILSMNFSIKNDNGDINEEITDIFKQKWFTDVLSYWIDTIFYGHSLIQVEGFNENADMKLSLVPRENVRPEFQEYTTNYWDVRGKDYTTDSLYRWLIEIGSKYNLGLLVKVSPLVLWKKYAMMFWAEFQEIFGTPIRVIKSKGSQSPEKRAELENFLRNMGSSGWGIMNENDSLDLVANQGSDAYDVYDKFINRLNNEISELIIGSTETTSGSDAGSLARAQVHQEQSDLKTQSDLRNITYFVNNELIPKLYELGFISTENIEFSFDDIENITLDEKSIIDERLIKIVQSGVFDREYLQNRYGVEINEVIPQSNEQQGL